MKIGILTFQQAINYGAILQLYALQYILNKFVIDVEVINYSSLKLASDYKLIESRKGLRLFFKSLFSIFAFFKKKQKFKNFSEKYLYLTKEVYSKENIFNLACEYDYIITGSDQVWNYKITNNDTIYLLDFVEQKKRLSYAASFGVSEIPKTLKQTYSKLLGDFKYLTVREKQGAKLVKDLCGRDVPVVLDPTLLLNIQDWKEISDCVPISSKKIVVYTLSRSALLMNIAYELSRITSFDVAVINPSTINLYDKTSAYTSGPEEFINLLMNAEYILTNSFHGTAFAVNFNKKFLVELPDGERGKVNSRIENLLEMLNLKDRYVDCLDLRKMEADIDWEKVNKILDLERIKSIRHLEMMIDKNE